jgi:hypothetical protein
MEFCLHALELADASASVGLVLLLRSPNLRSHLPRVFAAGLRAMLKKKFLKRAEWYFAKAASTFPDILSSAVWEVIHSQPIITVVESVCKFWSRLASTNCNEFAAIASLEIAKIKQHYPAFVKVIQPEMDKHAASFRSVAQSKNLFVLGTFKGAVHVFSNKHHLSAQVFCAGIDAVAIAPSETAVAALSSGLQEIAVLQLSHGRLGKKRLTVVRRQSLEKYGEEYHIEWSDGESCICTAESRASSLPPS